ncbi:MAG: cytochrome C [Planctomycetes bacterium]|nr:cytochrome C [Planctomycetota bacterium]
MRRITPIIGVAAAATAYLTVASLADITGSAHDFSGSVWANGEICLPCHAPHSVASPGAGPLWNHAVTTASYEVYGPDPGNPYPTAEALDEGSILCMSCHDGTVAVDAFGGGTGSFTITGDSNLGTDLTDDHPVGRSGEYPSHGGFVDPALWEDTAGHGFNLKEMIIDTVPTPVVGCGTCHEAHNRNNLDYFLWVDNAGSALCLTCHNK